MPSFIDLREPSMSCDNPARKFPINSHEEPEGTIDAFGRRHMNSPDWRQLAMKIEQEDYATAAEHGELCSVSQDIASLVLQEQLKHYLGWHV